MEKDLKRKLGFILEVKKGKMKNIKMFYGGIFLIMILFSISFASAGIGDWFRQITGWASDTYDVNISLSGINPVVIYVWNESLAGIPLAGSIRNIEFNITVTDTDGNADINLSSVTANFSNAGEQVRSNFSCLAYGNQNGTNSVNFSCTIGMFYFDENEKWDISVCANDFGNKTEQCNTTQDITYGALDAIDLGPGLITWPSVSPGDTNKTPADDPTQLNNTGNTDFYNVTLKAINLYAEGRNEFIDVANLSVSNATGGSCSGATCVECTGVSSAAATVPTARTMSNGTFVNITYGILTRGNYSIDDGNTGQELVYYCIRLVPVVPTASYSTAGGGSWTLNVATI